MRADRFRETIARSEKIYRSGLSIIVSIDSYPGTLVRWETVVNLSYRFNHLRPAEPVSEMLR